MSSDSHNEMLLDFLVPLAKQRLGEAGVFAPFGAVLSNKGELTYLRGADDDVLPPEDDVFSHLQKQAQFLESTSELTAAAFVANAFMEMSPDRYSGHIGVHVECQGEEATLFLMRYLRSESKKFWLFGETKQLFAYEPIETERVPSTFLWTQSVRPISNER